MLMQVEATKYTKKKNKKASKTLTLKYLKKGCYHAKAKHLVLEADHLMHHNIL